MAPEAQQHAIKPRGRHREVSRLAFGGQKTTWYEEAKLNAEGCRMGGRMGEDQDQMQWRDVVCLPRFGAVVLV
ncbi:hypothetical protein HBI56_230270 [Parastagonospora nodorum]|uniref:Uncharacterized protein n=1 Tax=Phaeosphaeria nodorum (strain SN15 / ATCC MYA-4574 / FGSC 10173) TaxID=321614 RepID=Q0TWG5_PHANO|nr:hypothetical protein SNOG_16092 [Parastagonospora nodorum SN15]KAH3959934.1 hypothetical protein HBH52_241420 [Parastagonospora nodorum]EAT76464.1 hypothetical protein SNOG_16092 [Parastagonospora nodorum SN15]KAH3991697.1 hypothetical protein HBI10_227620 [Parastagonospora nodorum]KAH4008836.1 hypothetical protein HBI13_230280 [Parastagonospora nodorum]KAH4012073.1 hypothetical protein HBI09_223750 [Parastagonospora nodorum]